MTTFKSNVPASAHNPVKAPGVGGQDPVGGRRTAGAAGHGLPELRPERQERAESARSAPGPLTEALSMYYK